MGKSALRAMAAVLVLVSASFAVSVSVSTPANNSTVSSPVTFKAAATSTHPITGWRIYVDGISVYLGGATANIAPSVNISTGTHSVIVRAWDSSGAYGSSYLTVTAGSTPAPAPAPSPAPAPAPTGVTVTVASPAANTTVTSPTTINASASSLYAVTGWHIYVDGVNAYSGGATNAISAPVTMTAGTHQLIVRAWNSTGAYGSANFSLTVGSATPSADPPAEPTAPSTATKLTRLEETSNWGKCSSGSCSGGTATTSSYWFAPFQSTPSLDGSSTEFFIAGPAYATDLFWLHLPPTTAPSHFIFEFDVYLDQASYTAAEALEFDLFQVVGGLKYQFASECNYWTKTWDVWNEATQHWIHSNAVCNKFQPDTWHHVKWAVERVGMQTHYLSITVDSNTQTISDAYAYQPAPATNWSIGAIGFQVQQDLSATPGSGFHEWIDRVTVYEW